jgi:hypothetical protein
MRPKLCLSGAVYILTQRSHATAPKQQDFHTGRGAGIDWYPVVIVGHNCGLGTVQPELVFHLDSLELIVFSDHVPLLIPIAKLNHASSIHQSSSTLMATAGQRKMAVLLVLV